MTPKKAACDTRINASRRIFLKTGTLQRSQIVALLRSAQAIVHPSGKNH
jgi:hypothetical protein